jgi:hypothetical protein
MVVLPGEANVSHPFVSFVPKIFYAGVSAGSKHFLVVIARVAKLVTERRLRGRRP